MPLVRCKLHGRIYDSDTASGCPDCLRGRGSAPVGRKPPTPSKGGSPRLLYMMLGAVVVFAGGYFVLDMYQQQQVEAAAAAERARLDVLRETPVDTTHFARADDLTPIRRARALEAAIASLVASNSGTLLRFGEGLVDTAVADAAAKRRALAYTAFATRWHGRLDAATVEGRDFRYAPGVQFSLQMDQVNNHLAAAYAVARDMVPRDRVKSLAERRSDLTAVRGYLNGARTVLSNLPETSRPRTRRTTARR